jgi:hypothetical protein
LSDRVDREVVVVQRMLARRCAWGVVVAGVIAAPLVSPTIGTAAAATVCGQSAGETVCLSSPTTGTGTITVAATRSGTQSAGTMEFYLDGDYLNFEYQRPYEFAWPTNKELDGVHTLSARLHLGSTYGAFVSASITLQNGNSTSVPRSPSNWQQLFRPQSGQVLAAVGNLGAQKPAELKLEQYVESTRPAVFGYLGEVHEFGTWATTLDHYGTASFDDPAGVGSEWGRMAAYTLPTPGNHQRDYITEFQDYWHQRPLWSTTTLGGVRVYDLTSECKANGGCLAAGAQATWLRTQLASNTEPCILAMWHRPVVSRDSQRSGDTMATVWQMLAAAGGDLVLNADTRDMEETKPLNAALQTSRSDSHMVELISGAGAARWVADVVNDNRVAWRAYKIPGAVWVHGAGTQTNPQLSWEFRNSSGTVLRTGSVGCA